MQEVDFLGLVPHSSAHSVTYYIIKNKKIYNGKYPISTDQRHKINVVSRTGHKALNR
jgi:hypothetical protein